MILRTILKMTCDRDDWSFDSVVAMWRCRLPTSTSESTCSMVTTISSRSPLMITSLTAAESRELPLPLLFMLLPPPPPPLLLCVLLPPLLELRLTSKILTSDLVPAASRS